MTRECVSVITAPDARRHHMTRSPVSSAQWWKILAGGVALLVGIVVVTTITGELGDSAWLFMVILLLGAIGAIAAGLILGVAHLAGRRDREPSH
jgi:hypothetical protein